MAPCHARPHRLQGRLERDARRGIERRLLAAERALEVHEPPRRLERVRIRVHDELAVLHVVEVQGVRAHQRAHEVTAVEREAQQALGGEVGSP
jgi:hypothetical protein